MPGKFKAPGTRVRVPELGNLVGTLVWYYEGDDQRTWRRNRYVIRLDGPSARVLFRSEDKFLPEPGS